jgi:hypothetical protein
LFGSFEPKTLIVLGFCWFGTKHVAFPWVFGWFLAENIDFPWFLFAVLTENINAPWFVGGFKPKIMMFLGFLMALNRKRVLYVFLLVVL